MPIPLAMMIPFMAVQSMVMGDAFGRSYQYGKRKISAMTNEEFNAYDKLSMAQEIFTDYKNIIPELKKSIQDSTELQATIVSEMLQLVPKIASSLFGDVIDTAKDIITTEGEDASRKGTNPNRPTKQPDTTTLTPKTNTTQAHDNSHNDILTKYDEAKIMESELIRQSNQKSQLTGQGASARARNAGAISRWTVSIKSLQNRLLQLMAQIGALQKNHSQNYGHQVTPYSTRI